MIFKGNRITVKVLSHKDLIATKFYSYCIRNLKTDKDDLIDLKPSKDELHFAKQWVLSLEDCPEQKFVTDCFEEIMQLTNKS